MKRITLKQAEAAYKKLGIKPIYGEYFKVNGNKDCTGVCVLTALYLKDRRKQERGKDFDVDTEEINDWADERYGREYSGGIMDGFDATLGSKSTDSRDSEFTKGFQDGQMLRRALKPRRA